MDFFQQLFPRELLEDITNETNNYADNEKTDRMQNGEE